MKNRIVSVSNLTGTNVYNRKGKKIGTIEDIAIDLVTGQVLYGVLSFGGFLGMGDKHFAVPPKALQFGSHHENKITIDVDKDKLKDAPGFGKDKWPAQHNTKFIDSVYTHYGYEWKATPY